MMHLEIGGARIPVPVGETIIGSAPGCAIVLEGEGVQPRHAILQGTPQGAAAIRAGEPGADPMIVSPAGTGMRAPPISRCIIDRILGEKPVADKRTPRLVTAQASSG
jgi:hypothetical protein